VLCQLAEVQSELVLFKLLIFTSES